MGRQAGRMFQYQQQQQPTTTVALAMPSVQHSTCGVCQLLLTLAAADAVHIQRLRLFCLRTDEPAQLAGSLTLPAPCTPVCQQAVSHQAGLHRDECRQDKEGWVGGWVGGGNAHA